MDGIEPCFQLPLSGSPRGFFDYYDPVEKNFQLPLSGSLFSARQYMMRAFSPFQLPLSGSQEGPSDTTDSLRSPELSTPSLGITGSPAFVEEKFLELSTPSLGITEPDSGIFRLSAAFCRGTSSHK